MSIRNLKLEVVLAAIDKATRPIKGVINSTAGLSKQLQDTKARLKELNGTQQKLDAFTALKKSQQDAAASMQKVQDRTRELALRLNEARQAAKPLQETFAAAQARTDQLRTSQKELTKQIRQQQDELGRANAVWEKQRAKIAAVSEQIKKSPTDKLRAEYSQLTAAQVQNLAKVRELDASLQKLKGEKREGTRELFKYRGELQHAKGAAKEAAGQVSRLGADFNAARESSRKLKDQQARQTKELQDLRRGLQAAGISTKDMAGKQAALREQIRNTTESIQRQNDKLAKLAARQNQMHAARSRYERSLENRDRIAGAGAGMMAAGATTGAAVTVPISAYAQAEDAAMQLRVSMMEKGGKVKREYADIVALAERLGNRLPGTTADFQEMMTTLNRQGMSAKAILGGVGEASAYLGVQLKLPYSQAAEYAAKMQDATGALEKDMMGVMDTIQRTYQVGVDPGNMVAGFAKLAPVLDMIKQKGLAGAQTMAPLLAMADQASLVGESAGNAYRKVFQRSMDAKKITKGNKLAKDAGIQLDFTNGKGEFGGLDKMFNQLAKLKKLNTQQRNAVIAEIWGDDAETLQALNVMIDKGQTGYREMQQKMAAQASLQERVNAQLGTLKNLWDAATGTFTNAMVRFGEAIAPELKALTEWIANASEGLGNWAKENPALVNALMKIAGISAIVLTVLGGLALAISGVLGPFIAARFAMSSISIVMSSGIGIMGRLGSALGMIGRVMMWLGRVFLMNPIGLVVTAIAAAAYLIWRNWDWIGPKFAALWDGIKNAAGAAWDWIKAKAIGAGQLLASFFMNWTLPGLIIKHWDGITAFIGALPARFATLGSQIMQGLVSGITSGLAGVKNAITGAGDSTIAWFKEKLGIHSPSRVFAELGGFTMAGLSGGLEKGSAGPLAAIKDFAGNLIDRAKGIVLPAPAIAPQDEDRAITRQRVLAEPPPLLQRIQAALPDINLPALDLGGVANGFSFDALRDLAGKITAAGAGLAIGTATAAPVPIDTRPPISAARPAPAASTPAQINITINAAPGMNEQQLAQLVARELARAQQQQAARGRSRLTDKD